jgi:pyruvate/2-oxoglutarate dehydrogenase complex dihydrolipoamide acyltransferase (E2) component
MLSLRFSLTFSPLFALQAFDSVDELYIAKHLVPAGSEVLVGAPIMITVEDAASVAAFASYTLPPIAAAVPEVKKILTPPPTPVVAAVKATPPPVKTAPPTLPPPLPKQTAPSPPSASSGGQWGVQILKSPLLQKLIQEQSSYVARYGHNLHQVLTKVSIEKL